MLDIQKYLLTHSFGELAAEHEIYPSGFTGGYKFSLNYDMIAAKNDNKFVQECRGIILGASNKINFNPKLSNKQLDDFCPGETTVIAYPFNRFFNYGQEAAASIHWNDPNLRVMEKLDGSLTILYHDSFIDEWCVATRSVPEAHLPINGCDMTFRTLFEKALLETSGYSFSSFTSMLDKSKTYCFELCSPYNQVVVRYPSSSLTLLMIRNLKSLNSPFKGEEFLPDFLFGVPKVKSHSLSNINDVVDFVSNLEPSQHEGVVVCDSSFNRIKVKNPGYLALNRIVDNVAKSQRGMMELILSGKEDDAIAFLPPDLATKLSLMKESVAQMIVKMDKLYLDTLDEASLSGDNDAKQFASTLLVKDKVWAAPMFAIFRGKATDMKDFLQKAKKEGTWSNSFLDSVIEHL